MYANHKPDVEEGWVELERNGENGEPLFDENRVPQTLQVHGIVQVARYGGNITIRLNVTMGTLSPSTPIRSCRSGRLTAARKPVSPCATAIWM